MSSVVASLASGSTSLEPATKTARGLHLINSLPTLQNALKRSPAAYREEFLSQWALEENLREMIASGSGGKKEHEKWRECVTFVGNVGHLYKDLTDGWPAKLGEMLLRDGETWPAETRKTIVGVLVGVRRRGGMEGVDLLKILFPFLSKTPSSSLRTYILKTILSDIKTSNTPTKNHKLNRTVQSLLFSMVERGMSSGERSGTGTKGGKGKNAEGTASSIEGKEGVWAVKLATELWKKGVWRDEKTVSIIRRAVFHPHTKVQSIAIHFFLDEVEGGGVEEDSEEEEAGPNEKLIRKMKHQQEINKKTKAREREAKKKLREMSKKRKRKQTASQESVNFSALQLLQDPQDFADAIYEHLVKYDKSYAFEHKLLLLKLFGRVTGYHRTLTLPYYSYILRYLNHHQLQITSILASLCSSIHPLLPPDALPPIIRKLANEFVHPGVASEVIAVGLNAIREICRRQPLAMEGEEDLVEDLVEYKKSGDKGVMMAARSLLQLWRETMPSLLKKKERGKNATIKSKSSQGVVQAQYGGEEEQNRLDGLALLANHLEEREQEEEDEKAWDEWEAEEDSSESEDGWINVESDDEDDIEISDMEKEDEDPEKVVEKKEDAKKKAFELATSRILTPADYAKMNELMLAQAEEEVKNSGGTAAKKRLNALKAKKKEASSNAGDGLLTEGDIEGVRKKEKATYEERMESIAKGREGREKFGSAKGKKKQVDPSSTTNEQKRKGKAFAMIQYSGQVRKKGQVSLREKQKRLRGHINMQKKGKRFNK
ncbi:SDA1-domain-containing protein [Atractiella rhizophila]|nr:SDA1-domain-containing protein [Atractiella rhizophila]